MTLSPKQEQAALLISAGLKLKDIAEELQITPATLCNWQKDSDFRLALNNNLFSTLEAARERMIGLASKSLDTLQKLLESENDQVRLSTCKLLLGANGLVGDNEKAFLRYGWGISPK